MAERDLVQIRLPAWGRVAASEGPVPWLLVDDLGEPVEPVRRFLTDFVARGNRMGSVRSYAYGLLRWWRWLRAVDVQWDRATPGEARDYVLWLQFADKPRPSPRTVSASQAGTTNAITGKEYLDDRYRPTQAEQWLPASSEAFVWLRLYLAEVGPLASEEPVWRTVRQRDRGAGPERQPLNYEAMRAIFRRVNARLGTNWTMHDLRHTAALRMSRDSSLSIRDVQCILGHRHLDTTVGVYLIEDDITVARRVLEHLTEHERRSVEPRQPTTVASGYDVNDLRTLLRLD